MQAARLTLVVLIPATMLMMAASVPLMRLAYGPGSVSRADVRLGAGVLAVYVLAMSTTGLTQLAQKGIYADGDFVTPLKVELLTIGLYVAAAFALSSVWSIVGLAVAAVCRHMLNMFLTFWLVRRRRHVPSVRQLAAFALRPLLAGGIAVAFYGVAYLAVDRAHPSPSYVITAAEQMALLLASGGVYVVVASLLGIEEVRVLWRAVPSVRSRRAITQEAA